MKGITMCMATPAKILSLREYTAIVDIEGIQKEINISLINKPKPGNYVIIHAGFAIQKWTDSDVKEFYKIKKDLESLDSFHEQK